MKLSGSRLIWVFVGVIAALGSVALARPVQAAFPGGNGKLALEHSEQEDFGLSLAPIRVVNADGTGFGLLPIAGGHPQWSPDGSQIAYIKTAPSDQFSGDVYVANADGTDPRLVVANVLRSPCRGRRTVGDSPTRNTAAKRGSGW